VSSSIPSSPFGGHSGAFPGRWWLFVAALIPVGLFMSWIGVQDRLAGLGIDDAFYLLLADQYYGRLSGEPALAAVLQTRTYPPLYPLLLGAVGGGSEALLPAFALNAAFSLLWIAAYLGWILRAGTVPIAAVLLAWAATLAPFTILHAPNLWSEHLYLALALAALAVLERPTTAHDQIIAGALIGLGVLTRSAGVALVLAFALHSALRRPRGAWIALALAALPLLERLLHPATVYGSELRDLLEQPLGIVFERIAANAAGMWLGWRLDWSMADTPASAGPAILLALAALGWFTRLRAGRLDALWVPIALAMLLIWGFQRHAPRFLYPLCPLALYYAWLGGCMLTARWTRHQAWQSALAAVLLLVIATPALDELLRRRAIPLDPHLADYKRTQLWLAVRPARAAPDVAAAIDASIDDMLRVRELVPHDACVHTVMPGLLLVYAHRPPYLAPWRTNAQLASASGLPCRYAYLDPAAIDGIQDAATLASFGIRVLYESPHSHTERESEANGVLVELPE
jgi:hypothetical protein